MFKHNLWANLQMLEACSRLTGEQLDAVIPGTYGSIRSTLLHMIGAEEGYLARLKGQPRPPLRNEAGFTGFDDLRAAATRSGEAPIEIAEKGPPTEFLRYVDMEGDPVEMTSAVMLVQVINHATEHRDQVNAVLTYLKVNPCDLDGWAYGMENGTVKIG
jgi:uncharacterized damage-inducible protein DinB